MADIPLYDKFPSEIKNLQSTLKEKNIEDEQVKFILKDVIKVFTGKDDEIDLEYKDSTDVAIYVGLKSLFRHVINRPDCFVNKKALPLKLHSELNFPESICSLITSSVHRVKLNTMKIPESIKTLAVLPTVKDIQWRVNISIANNNLNSVMLPSVFLSLHLTDNNVISFEMDIKNYHRLRYKIAKALSDIIN